MMFAHFEDNRSPMRSDCTVQSLSWMGQSLDAGGPADLSGQKRYCRDGWLSTGNAKGIVGVTFTSCAATHLGYSPPRTNFNLRGHRSEVVLVRWNEPFQKLATCDASGVIFVWIKHEGRWSIELINDRNSQVTDFAWSHEGHMALICYRDGFVLAGSVAGQRYWSTMINLEGCSITCCTWTPDDEKVMFGTSDGRAIVMTSAGAMVTHVTLEDDQQIHRMEWNCEKFFLDDWQESEEDTSSSSNDSCATKAPRKESKRSQHLLAVCFSDGFIHLMNSYDDAFPKVLETNLLGLRMEWSNEGDILAVTGFTRLPDLTCQNELRLYTNTGHLRFLMPITSQTKPVLALTWGHLDHRLFVAIDCFVYTARVEKRVPCLQYFSQRCVQAQLRHEAHCSKLPLPCRIQESFVSLFTSTIRGFYPKPHKLREFVCIPPPGEERVHCTMIRHGETEGTGEHYTLYLEYLGGLIPLLKGKRASKLRPEFVIYDPKIKGSCLRADDEDALLMSSEEDSSRDSDSGDDFIMDNCASPRMQRKRLQKRRLAQVERRDSAPELKSMEDMMYDDNLPEASKLVEVTSNIWGTKFKIHGLASYLPEDLGEVVYKTSLLHLQPRQMTISIMELTCDELRPHKRDPSYNPNHFSESEDESAQTAHPPANKKFSAHLASLQLPNHSTSNYASISPETASAAIAGLVEVHSSFKETAKAECFPVACSIVMPDEGLSRQEVLMMPEEEAAAAFPQAQPENLTTTNVMQMVAQRLQEDSASALSSSSSSSAQSRWAEHPCTDFKYIDEDAEEAAASPALITVEQMPPSASPLSDLSSVSASSLSLSSSKYSNTVPSSMSSPSDSGSSGRLSASSNLGGGSSVALVTQVSSLQAFEPQNKHIISNAEPRTKSKLKDKTFKSNRCIEIARSECTIGLEQIETPPKPSSSQHPGGKKSFSFGVRRRSSLESRQLKKDSSASQSTSLPSSPSRAYLKKQCVDLFRWPSFTRSRSKSQAASDDESTQEPNVTTSDNFKNLQAFQKAQMNRKLKQARRGTDDTLPNVREQSNLSSPSSSMPSSPQRSPVLCHHRHPLIMHNKAPMWNENSQVYQLDFGGRVTQESAKNFQVEFKTKQVMQFGRIESNAYTLDFQYPFSSIQAFAVALANVTQRLK